MEISMIPDYILDDLASRGVTAEKIENSSPEDLFDEWCMWNGFIGYSSTFINVIDSLRSAQKA